MKIAFLINNAYGIGGTIRATANLSGAFAERGHEVEVVSVNRPQDAPRFAFDPRVTLTPLVDTRAGSPGHEGGHELTRRPTTMFGYSLSEPHTALQDHRIAEHLTGTDADVVIATRPDLNGYLARDGRHGRFLRLGQEHLSLAAHRDQVRADQNAAVLGLDAFLTVSEADAAAYRAALPRARTRILCIPNSVPTPDVAPAGLDSRTIVAAGRLIPVKRYDRLVTAFAKVAAEHPDWTLRLYGRGAQRTALRERIDELGLYDRAFLMGAVSPIETEWAKGAVAAVSSDMESFGMTIVEAMHCGVPVVATDCPHGPAEIITHERDGLLTPLSGDADALADALKRLIADEPLRRRLGAAAREKARAYAPDAIAARYETLFEELTRARRRTLSGAASRVRERLARERRARGPRAGGRGASAPTALAPSSPPGPLALCATATADGGLLVRPGPGGRLPGGPRELLLRLRHDPEGRELRVPVPEGGAGRRVPLSRAEHVLPEGRWDCYLVPAGGTAARRWRITARIVEQAALLGREPDVGPHGVSSWIPYTTTDGFLALRTWLRPAHAEVERIHVGRDDQEELTVTATLYGTEAVPPRDARVTATTRSGRAPEIVVPARPTAGAGFTFVLPYAEPVRRGTGEDEPWDLRLTGPGLPAPVPLGRIGGDVADRRRTDVLPATTVGGHRVQPCFTADNALTLSVRPETA
ncbi:glycosyltransferase family 4 protein [Streptomyces griseoaurantiacus]|uniref:D-inositol 3-phosphate glycosyltransferase n=1 Tax=Streptomyces griseoaurantiacus TaxID=68213 RepID=A0A7W2E072_9ACTN|nr:glycosyltransferase family 4 protein [Streptomyces griseoaurantiacus]MBA5226137.1 glycosyltransferase family 4 protein [Streptomyces griseoaurantiacus]